MKEHMVYSTFCFLLICLIPRNVHPCTAFCIDKGNQLVVGFNFDWGYGEGSLIVNKRNVSKTAILNPELTDCQPASWTSKYGSVTFNMGGREFTGWGMNEAGLVINYLGAPTSDYPPPDSRKCISEIQWTQYYLDNFSKIEQVIASNSNIRIAPATQDARHLFMCDNTGSCAVLEFIDGKMVYYTKETLPAKVLSNDMYDNCIISLNLYKSWGGDLDVPQSGGAYDRFVRAADMIKNYDPKKSKSIVDYAFNILANLEWSMLRQWSIVYDIKNSKIFFQTLENKQIRYFTLSSFDFSCKTPVQALDITADLSGEVTNKFTNYSYERNRDYIKVFNLPEGVTDIFARYPESTKCMEK
jgi:choloylglycine hydrolase